MQELIVLISNPLVWKILIGYWVFSAFVGALPSPEKVAAFQLTPLQMFLYTFFFGFMNLLASNVSRAALAFKVPGSGN